MSALIALLDPSEPTPWPTLEEQIAQSQGHDAGSSAQGKGRGAELVRRIRLPACALPSAAEGQQGETPVELRVWKSSSGSSSGSGSGSAEVYAFEARAVGEDDEQVSGTVSCHLFRSMPHIGGCARSRPFSFSPPFFPACSRAHLRPLPRSRRLSTSPCAR